ncbi:MAG: hypothetical protein AAFQ98_00280 [Bacteroidota bacterium]
MAGISFHTVRAGKRYRLTNYGEVAEFEVLEINPGPDFVVKDLNTLETYRVSDLVRYGKGPDYSLWEI